MDHPAPNSLSQIGLRVLPGTASPTDPPTAPPKAHLLGLSPDELKAWVASDLQQPAWRAGQILEWIYRKDARDFAAMSNLAAALREQLREQAMIYAGSVARESVSEAGDGTTKLLVQWPDAATVECVWIPTDERDTACISSQVGCPVGCRFCASGLDGVVRNLTAGEIVEQALLIRSRIRAAANDPAARLDNIVFMGMGEPLANYDNVVRAIRILNHPDAFGLGARKITLSTVGLPVQIRRLAEEGVQLNLALSLHAPNETLRRELIPWGKVPLPDLLDACRYYFEKTGREITLEYILLRDVNMSSQHARELAEVARSLRCNINLLRYNPVPGLPFVRPSAEEAVRFQAALRQRGVNAHTRRSRGRRIDAACGQLRRSTIAAGVDSNSAGSSSSSEFPTP
ncbi:MAG: 23S rRNA (adenine(2503)-C(2))-methyltransferase RlmN [Phycisphaerae bacterium]|nr:23S rRNA (adenine(2503)-C(2))-methyltransferase RlmN [Phycisphaerae bacterium]